MAGQTASVIRHRESLDALSTAVIWSDNVLLKFSLAMRDKEAACDTASRFYRVSAGGHSRGRGRELVTVVGFTKLA